MQANTGSADQRFEGALFEHVTEKNRELANCSTADAGHNPTHSPEQRSYCKITAVTARLMFAA
jgi:hypothetical protein